MPKLPSGVMAVTLDMWDDTYKDVTDLKRSKESIYVWAGSSCTLMLFTLRLLQILLLCRYVITANCVSMHFIIINHSSLL